MKKYVLLFLLSIILLAGINVHAKGLAYYLSNKDMNYFYRDKNSAKTYSVQRGDIISVISIIDSEDVNYLLKEGKMTLRWDENVFEIVNYGIFYSKLDYNNTAFIGNPTVSNNKISFRFSDDENIPDGKSRLFEFKFRVLDTAKTGTYKIYQMDDEDTLSCLDNTDTSKPIFNCASSYYTEIRYKVEGSSNNYLRDIKIDDQTIPNFNKKNFSYNIDTDKDKIVIAIVKDDTTSSASGDTGLFNLKYGLNTFNISVTSENGNKVTYTLNVKRNDKRSKINTLKNLDITDVNINFSPDVLTYDYTVKNEITKVTVKAELTDSKSVMNEDYSNKVVMLSEGVNRIAIKVTAENGDEKTYVINITRELSGNNTLKKIEINNKTIEIKDNIFSYNFEVGSDVETVDINAVPSDKKSFVNIEKANKLVEGENDIRILVTAPNGNEVAYHLIVTRKKKLSANSSLSSLVIEGYDINFRKDKFYYELEIKDEESLLIDAIPEEENSTIEIEGNRDLIDGSIIKINIKAQDGTYTRYFITIEKNAHNYLPIVIGLCLLCLVVILAILISSSKKKKIDHKLDEALDNSNWEEERKDDSKNLVSKLELEEEKESNEKVVDETDLDEEPEEKKQEEKNIEDSEEKKSKKGSK